MAISEAMKRWLTPPAVRADNDWSRGNSAPPQHDKLVDKAPVPEMRPRKRKRVSSIVDVDDMSREGFTCCNRLRCVESFVLGKGDIRTLRAEQAAMAKLTGAGRSHFVHSFLPLVKPARNTGAMIAGHQPVCTAFFRRAFNVSNNMIQILKNNPESPGLKGYVRRMLLRAFHSVY